MESNKGREGLLLSLNRLTAYPFPEIFGLAALVLLVSYPCIGGEILSWDDVRYIKNNEYIRSFQHIPYVLTHDMFEAYHPVHIISYMLDYALWGLWAPGYHLHNILIYIISLIFLNTILLRFGVERKWGFLLCALFALHPLHVESLVWITGRKELLSFLFFVIATVAYLRMQKWITIRGVVVIFFFLLSILSKSHAMIFPFWLLGIEIFINQKKWKDSIKKVIPVFILAIVFCFIVFSLWSENELARPKPGSLSSHVALVLETYFFYVCKLLIPIELSPIYKILRGPQWQWTSLLMVALFALFSFFIFKKKNQWMKLGLFWFVASLLPVSNIVPVYFYVADRYAFWSVLTLVFLLIFAKERIAKAGKGKYLKYAAIPFVITTAVYGLIFWNYSHKWIDDLTLWRHATNAQPESYYAHMKFGEVLRDNDRFVESIEEYKMAISLQPDFKFAWIGLCWVESARFARKHNRSREEWLTQVYMLHTNWDTAHGAIEARNGMIQNGYLACAEIAENRYFKLKPPDEQTVIQAATAWVQLGNPQKALNLLKDVHPIALNVKVSFRLVKVEAFLKQGQKEKAMIELLKVEKLNDEFKNNEVKEYIIKIKESLKNGN